MEQNPKLYTGKMKIQEKVVRRDEVILKLTHEEYENISDLPVGCNIQKDEGSVWVTLLYSVPKLVMVPAEPLPEGKEYASVFRNWYIQDKMPPEFDGYADLHESHDYHEALAAQ